MEAEPSKRKFYREHKYELYNDALSFERLAPVLL
jgi:hypothetical protein